MRRMSTRPFTLQSKKKSTWDLRSCGRANSFRFKLRWYGSHHDTFGWTPNRSPPWSISPFTLRARCFDQQAIWVPWRCMICTRRAWVDDKWVGKTWRLGNLSAAFIRCTTERRRLWMVSMLESHSEKYACMAYLPCSIIPWRLGSECIWRFWKYRRSTMWDHEVCWSYTSLYSRWHGHTKFIIAMYMLWTTQ